MKNKLKSLILLLFIVMLATPLLAAEVVPRFKFYSSVVYDPNDLVEASDGFYTVEYPITTATPVTKTGEFQYPTFDILPDTLVYPTYKIAPNTLTYPTFQIENILMPYDTFDIQKNTLTYDTFLIDPVKLEYPTYELVNDSLTCNTYDLVQEQVMCDTYTLTMAPVCQDVPYTTYEITAGESCVDHTTWTIDFDQCSNGVIVGSGVSRMCADVNDKINCCWPLQRDLEKAVWKCYGVDPSLSLEVEAVCPTTAITEETVPVCVPTQVATPVQKSVQVCIDSTTATKVPYPIDTVRAMPTTTQLVYQKAVPAVGYLDSIKATPTSGSLDTIKAVPVVKNLNGIKATETTGTLESIKATPTTGTLDTIKAVPKTETATYEYSTFEVTEEVKLIDVYVDVPEDIDPPAVVTDTFVGTPNLQAKAWFFTRPRGGTYVTDIRVVRVTGGNGTPKEKTVLEAFGSINKVKNNYAGSEKVELSKGVPTDQPAQIRITFKATAPNGDYRKRKVFINVWDMENPEANALFAEDLASIEEEE